MKFNGYDFNELIVEDVKRSFLTPSDFVTMETVNGRSRFYRRNIISHSIEVEARIILDNEDEVRSIKDDLRKKLFTFEPQRLELPDEPNRYNIAICQSENFEINRHTGFTTLTFHCFDPYLYDKESKTASITNGKVTLDNQGLSPTYATFKLKPSANKVIITNQTTGEHLEITGRLSSVNGLMVDCENEQISLDNNNAMQLLSFDSDFFKIQQGENEISVEGATGTIEWTERW